MTSGSPGWPHSADRLMLASAGGCGSAAPQGTGSGALMACVVVGRSNMSGTANSRARASPCGAPRISSTGSISAMRHDQTKAARKPTTRISRAALRKTGLRVGKIGWPLMIRSRSQPERKSRLATTMMMAMMAVAMAEKRLSRTHWMTRKPNPASLTRPMTVERRTLMSKR